MVCIFGNDVDIVTDAEIALECFYKADAAILELLVANHLDLECILDGFKNRCRGSRDDKVIVVDDCRENVGEFRGGAVEVAIHVDDELALIAKLLNCGRGVLLVFELCVA